MPDRFSKVKTIVGKLDELDWDFYSRANRDGSTLHWYPSRFVPEIPSILIGHLSNPGEIVLDPFMGCGTTVVEAVRSNRRAIGIDLNPIGILATKARLTRLSLRSMRVIEDLVVKPLQDVGVSISKNRTIPMAINIDEATKWYHPETLWGLIVLYSLVEETRNRKPYYLLKATFSSILNSVCSRREHHGWICDNVRPKEFIYYDTIKIFLKKLQTGIKANESFFRYLDFRNGGERYPVDQRYKVFEGDSQSLLTKIEKETVGLVITSPPYFGVTDYIKSFRLFSHWYPQELILEKKKHEIGARYKRHRINAKKEFLNALGGVHKEISRVLKNGRFLVLVLGQSPHRDYYIDELSTSLRQMAFRRVHVLKRAISLQRALKPSVLEEQIHIYRKESK